MGQVGTVGNYTRDSDHSERPVPLVQEWDALHTKHPGFQQSNIEEWLAIVVHEAFHAHQL